MDRIRIRGGKPLSGNIPVSGAKNAVLALMPAGLLAATPLHLANVPNLADVATMTALLRHLGMEVAHDTANRALSIAGPATVHEAPYDIVRKMRASVLVLGPLVARHGIARVSLPGGCAIGTRPVDLHLKGLEAMGATITVEGGYIEARAPAGVSASLAAAISTIQLSAIMSGYSTAISLKTL